MASVTIVSIRKNSVEAKDNAVKVLKVIKALDEQFATDYVVLILSGKLDAADEDVPA